MMWCILRRLDLFAHSFDLYIFFLLLLPVLWGETKTPFSLGAWYCNKMLLPDDRWLCNPSIGYGCPESAISSAICTSLAAQTHKHSSTIATVPLSSTIRMECLCWCVQCARRWICNFAHLMRDQNGYYAHIYIYCILSANIHSVPRWTCRIWHMALGSRLPDTLQSFACPFLPIIHTACMISLWNMHFRPRRMDILSLSSFVMR